MRTGNMAPLECLVQVQDLVIACDALAKFAAGDSGHLKAYAAATIEVCESCEAECRKFEAQHAQCKDCADSCVACMRECRKITA
jgi:Cys-rich four helix bundle protein (predicted Tat secretion target)